jgi:hypothetical protein
MSKNVFAVTQDQALQYAQNLRGARKGFQWSVCWAVGQTLQGNADGLYQIMRASGLLSSNRGEMTRLADGRQLMTYLMATQDQGGVGLKGIIHWSKEDNKFKMSKGWKAVADGLDFERLAVCLSVNLWCEFAKPKSAEPKPFNLDKALTSFVTRAANAGVTEAALAAALRELARKLDGNVNTSEKMSMVDDDVVTGDDLDNALVAALMSTLDSNSVNRCAAH